MRVMVLIMALLAAFRTTTAMGAASPATLLVDGWRQYKDRFVTSEGRVVDNANGGISHSEGQGYAMLIAERLDQRDRLGCAYRYRQDSDRIIPFRLQAASKQLDFARPRAT
jgi:endo-1,4-beta-D-glucanase Y